MPRTMTFCNAIHGPGAPRRRGRPSPPSGQAHSPGAAAAPAFPSPDADSRTGANFMPLAQQAAMVSTTRRSAQKKSTTLAICSGIKQHRSRRYRQRSSPGQTSPASGRPRRAFPALQYAAICRDPSAPGFFERNLHGKSLTEGLNENLRRREGAKVDGGAAQSRITALIRFMTVP